MTSNMNSNWPPSYTAYGITLSPLSQDMIETVRQWRNDPKIAELMLDKSHITAEQQQTWFDGLQGDTSRAYWVAYFKDEPIGVASLMHICYDSSSAEPGLYIYPEKYRNNIVPFCLAFALNDFAFQQLSLNVLWGKIYETNQSSMRFHQTCGYHQYDTKADGLMLVKLLKDDYEIAKKPIARYIRY
ncbi:UDP-4-amino-4,6-dideoxy-N-acetyl-beta-L-altrosamine N-acetyltransferase [Shewanella aestuarii]|uniref:UDP-4-amino-4, 6-dideoxy-N-acetyl-beta-L-altrosamine N-acetyltransferase n=1 Tax=Shewanella aestuarii TaxID=1028752 RepID=A0A6G9QII9_9GAMM|nr:UDP-4-amino-4,6-dideoxy-N-acetyl-beta-L-altrosamine N-acetyltransferase [Shewanella aestuarii]QIR13953.1 UDP-4-amino-4,6-dideoxy-N-acetyl-beta-L-altrosamine N-acetyltransferase [Shewanella aestuarii]